MNCSTETVFETGFADFAYRYIKTRSTEDKFANFLSFTAFGDEREKEPRDLKPLLHQFAGESRFHHATLVELEKDKPKLHESERLRLSLGSLVGYSEHLQGTWIKHKHGLRDMMHNPSLWITFFLLVHRGGHFRYTNKNGLEAATHTTLFTSFHDDDKALPIAIDFVQFNALPSALKQIADSFNHLAGHLYRYLSPSKMPFDES